MSSSNQNADSDSDSDSDPLSLLTRAISSSRSNSFDSHPITSDLLSKLYSILASNPSNLPILLPLVVNLPHQSIKSNPILNAWVIDFLDLCFNRPTLNQKDKEQLSPLVPSLLLTYIQVNPSNPILSPQDSKFCKLALQCFSSIYQSLVKNICTDKQSTIVEQSKKWKVITQIKRKALELIDMNPVEKFLGLKIAAIRALGRVVIVQSRVGGDPRKKAQDFSLSSIPTSHPILKIQDLENEATEMLTKIVTVAFTSSLPDIVTSTLTTLVTLSKSRVGQQVGEISLKALISWAPNALSNSTYMSKKNSEKILKLGLWHFLNNRLVSKEMGKEIGEALEKQRIRMEAEEKRNKEQREIRAKRKREGILKEIESENQQESSSSKRMRIEDNSTTATISGTNTHNANAFLSTGYNQHISQSALSSQRSPQDRQFFSNFDVSKLEINLLVDLIISSLQSVEERDMINAINLTRQNLDRELNLPPPPPPPAGINIENRAGPSGANGFQQQDRRSGITDNHEEQRPIDPLKIEVEDDEERLEKLELEWKNSNDRKEAEEEEGKNQGPSDQAISIRGRETSLQSQGKELEGNSGLESTIVGFENFVLELPKRLSSKEELEIIDESVSRIFLTGELESRKIPSGLKELKSQGDADAEEEEKDFLNGNGDESDERKGELWMMIVIRLITRGFAGPIGTTHQQEEANSKEAVESGNQNGVRNGAGSSSGELATINESMADNVRNKLMGYISASFRERYRFGVQWLSEEWISEKNRNKKIEKSQNHSNGNIEKSSKGHSEIEASNAFSNYSSWLTKLVEKVIEKLDPNDTKTLSSFLSELPVIPDSILRLIGNLCLDKKKISIGFSILREISTTRPKNRELCSEILLNLTRNKDKVVRGAAIITVRGWVSLHYLSLGMLEEKVIMYARENLERLILPKSREEIISGDVSMKEVKEESKNGEEETKEGEEEVDVIPNLKVPIEKDEDILRLVELPFALSIKLPSMLDEIFQSYVYMSSNIQASLRKNISPLIRSLGPGNSKLLSLLKNFPKGSDDLALHIFTILMEKGRSIPLISLIKNLIEDKTRNEEEINPRFLVPILPEFDKNEIMKYLPKVVTILNSGGSVQERTQDRNLIKQVFQSIVEMPDENFGSISTNLPRIKKDDLLTPTELMSVLHFKEEEIGIKIAAEAIKICFSMTEVFRSEVLAAVINQLVGEPVLPVLFMRTVITAVSTYKSLTGYVSTNILSELITKKVWQSPLIWDGFIICATRTSPGSSGALMQLPREQLAEVLKKQPSLKITLKEYATKKAGTNKARLKALLALLGDEDENVDGQGGGHAQINGLGHLNGADGRSRSGTPASTSLV